jgi:hypothetical protein
MDTITEFELKENFKEQMKNDIYLNPFKDWMVSDKIFFVFL